MKSFSGWGSSTFFTRFHPPAICGISVPCGFTAEQLPVGLHIVGPALREDVILKVGHAYEQATPWHLQKSLVSCH